MLIKTNITLITKDVKRVVVFVETDHIYGSSIPFTFFCPTFWGCKNFLNNLYSCSKIADKINLYCIICNIDVDNADKRNDYISQVSLVNREDNMNVSIKIRNHFNEDSYIAVDRHSQTENFNHLAIPKSYNKNAVKEYRTLNNVHDKDLINIYFYNYCWTNDFF